MWPTDLINRVQIIECSFGCVAGWAIVMISNVINIILFFAIGCENHSFLKNGRFMLLHQNPHQAVTRFRVSGFQCIHSDFLCPKWANFSCLHTRQCQMNFIWKDNFLTKSASYKCESQGHWLASYQDLHWKIVLNVWCLRNVRLLGMTVNCCRAAIFSGVRPPCLSRFDLSMYSS